MSFLFIDFGRKAGKDFILSASLTSFNELHNHFCPLSPSIFAAEFYLKTFFLRTHDEESCGL